jgi:hypothetical protein
MRAERILGIGAITTTNGPFASATPFENPDRPGHDSDRRRSRAICTARRRTSALPRSFSPDLNLRASSKLPRETFPRHA